MAKKPGALVGRSVAQELIGGRARLYVELRDPLRAWEAYLLARGTGLDVPAWVTDYLVRVARRMTEHSIALEEGRDLDTTLAHALELDGHGAGAVSAKRAALRRREQSVADVIAIMKKGYSQSKAITLLLDMLHSSDRGKDTRTIERALRSFRRTGWLFAGGRGGGALPLPSEATRQIKAH